jgi:hypothetical protein
MARVAVHGVFEAIDNVVRVRELQGKCEWEEDQRKERIHEARRKSTKRYIPPPHGARGISGD